MSQSTSPDLATVREWAKSAGIKVSGRGRIPKTVIEQYEAAQRN